MTTGQIWLVASSCMIIVLLALLFALVQPWWQVPDVEDEHATVLLRSIDEREQGWMVELETRRQQEGRH